MSTRSHKHEYVFEDKICNSTRDCVAIVYTRLRYSLDLIISVVPIPELFII